MKLILAGGTGFIGKHIHQMYLKLGYEVILIARNQGIAWDDINAITEAMEGADLVINMAGRSVDCRYNEKNKKEILDSRITTTNIIGKCISLCKIPPKLWMNSSTATIYRHAEDRPMTESNGELGHGFSVDVAQKWEEACLHWNLPHTRKILLRTAIVLGSDGGALVPMLQLARFGLGGKMGDGNQMFSWIHIDDVLNSIQWIQNNPSDDIIFNLAAPEPLNNKEVMQLIRSKVGIKFGIPTPKFLLTIGAVLLNTETELILKSRWVLPEKLLINGYTFKYPQLAGALKNL